MSSTCDCLGNQRSGVCGPDRWVYKIKHSLRMAERSSGPANRIIACGIPSVTAARAPEYQLAVNMFRGPVDLLQRMLG